MINEQILLFGLPIYLDKNTYIYQPSLNKMIEENYPIERILEPFIALDKRRFEEEEKNEKLNNFDILFLQIIIGYIQHLSDTKEDIELGEWINSNVSDWLIVKKLIDVLKFLMRTEDISLCLSDIKSLTENLEDNYIMVNKSYKINRDTFDDLKNLVFEMLDTEIDVEAIKPQKKVERTPEQERLDRLFEEKRKQYEKEYGKKEKKKKNKDNMNIFTLIDYIIHYKHTQYNYMNVRNLTIYQIKNTFKYYHGQEMYDIDMKYRTSGNFKMDKKSAEHWFFDK
jgi:Skp family chaperone for outer membrane proteins